MSSAPSLFEAMFTLLVEQGEQVTADQVNRVLADPQSQQDAFERIERRLEAIFPDGDVAKALGDHAPQADDNMAGQSLQDWRELAAIMYQAAGAYALPVRVLDLLAAAKNGQPFANLLDGVLPVYAPDGLPDDDTSIT